MKKFLSLVLALVMTMSLVTISAGAKEFTDDADITYDEAVAVISEIGVVDGDTDGSFRPTDGLTRGAAAKIICNLILGPTTAAELHADTAPFPDVPLNNTFSGYIAYCAKEGITSGYADGTFKPAAPLTGYAFMKMLLGALGYDSAYEGYTGANWSVNVAKQAIGIGLNVGLVDEFNGVDFVTREEAALYAFNTLKATLVAYENKITATVNGADVTISNTTAKPVTWSEGINNDGNIDPDTFVQFAEEYFPKLVAKDSSDDFERPATQWVYDKHEIGTYVRWEKMVESYTAGVTGQTIYELLSGAVIDDNDVLRYTDGGQDKSFDKDVVLVRSNKSDLANTGKGVLTEVYLDTDNDEIRIVSINTWLAQATSDYSSTSELATLKIYDSFNPNSLVTGSSTQSVDVEVVPAVADLKKDDFVLVNQSEKGRTRPEVVAISTPEILEDCTMTAFSKYTEDDHDANGASNKGRYKSVTTGGEKYDAAVKAYYDASVLNEYDADLMKDNSYNVYLDPYGYIIGLDLFEGTKNYVFITGYNRTSDSNISIETSQAAAIFLDGTMKPITVNVKDTNQNIRNVYGTAAYQPYFSNAAGAADEGNGQWVSGGEPNENKWYTYTVTDDGVYTLKPVKQQSATKINDIPGHVTANGVTTGTIDCSRVYLPDSYRNGSAYAYGEDASVYIVVSQDAVDTTNDKAITDVDGVYTGVQDVKIEIDSSQIAGINETTDLSLAPGHKTYHVDPIYTVYDGDGYVIASVVIGEAQGATKNYAYILSGATSEKVENGITYWSFDAVMGGKKVELTIEDKFGNTVQQLKPYSVQELMFDGDYVTKIKDITDEVTCALQRIDAGNDEVYDITFNRTNSGTSTSKVDYASSAYLLPADSGTAGTDTTTINLQGRTLYTTRMTYYATHGGDQTQPVGLTFVKDAPAVVIQVENGKKVTTECASVEEALGKLADANTSNNTPTTEGKQFTGRIVAVLDDMGVAEWAVFISSTPVTAGTGTTPSTPGYDVTGQELGRFSTLAEVNEALKTGNVVINGTWEPTDLIDGNNTLSLNGHDLWIKGSFDAEDNQRNVPGTQNIVINALGNETIKVDGKFTESQDVDCSIIAGSAELYLVNNMTVQSMTVSGALKVTGNNTLTIPTGKTVSAASLSTNGGDTPTINVNGTLVVNGDVQTSGASGTITINVNSSNSLHVTGTVFHATVNVGPASTAGKVVIGAYGTGSALVVTKGDAQVGSVASDATAPVVKKDGTLTITKELASDLGTCEAGAKITFTQNAIISGDAVGQFTNGTATVVNVGGLTFTADSTGSEFVNEAVKVDVLTGNIAFVWDQASFLAAGAPESWLAYGGKTGNAVWDAETGYAEQLAKHPYIYLTANVADGITTSNATISVTGVKINGQAKTLTWGSGDSNGTWNMSGKNSFKCGLDILAYEGASNISQTSATSIQTGDSIEVTISLDLDGQGAGEAQTLVLTGTYNGPSVAVSTAAAAG